MSNIKDKMQDIKLELRSTGNFGEFVLGRHWALILLCFLFFILTTIFFNRIFFGLFSFLSLIAIGVLAIETNPKLWDWQKKMWAPLIGDIDEIIAQEKPKRGKNVTKRTV